MMLKTLYFSLIRVIRVIRGSSYSAVTGSGFAVLPPSLFRTQA